VACVAMAFADWDRHRFDTWRLRDGLRSPVHQSSEVLMGTKKSGREFDRLQGVLQEASVGILEKGLYLAPSESPVSRLLQPREKESKVYLL
jgi:hypothetical protein